MARRPRREDRTPQPQPPSPPPPAGSDRERIVTAFLLLLGEKPFEDIELVEIAARAGVPLATLRDEFNSKLAIFAAHVKETDRAVLSGDDADMAEEPARERLFDVLMRRLELLEPHREAVRSLMRSVRRLPGLGLAINGIAVRSQQWMLTAAGLEAAGPRGMLRAQGLTLLFARVMRVWVDDDDPGLARTMAELDRGLARGQRWASFLDDLCRFTPSRCLGSVSRRRRRDESEEEPLPV
jgi:AcrR family transcriptional regulator